MTVMCVEKTGGQEWRKIVRSVEGGYSGKTKKCAYWG